MCGISGIIKKDRNLVSLKEIKEMNDHRSRGPDGEGFHLDNNIALGHRRLAIIDLTDAGSQPMSWRNKYWITFNGEIYNYIEIRLELQKMGHEFKSHSDTEVILAAYDEWGENCIHKFRGMWAFALYDTENRKFYES
jgi:asparagine synthase (glutamine-hydrolysing)